METRSPCVWRDMGVQDVHKRADRSSPRTMCRQWPQVSGWFWPAALAGGIVPRQDLGSSNGRFGVLKLPSPGRQGPAVLSALAPSRRVTAATPLCRPAMCRAGHGLDGNIFRAQQHERFVPIWQFSAAYSATCRAWRTTASVKSSGCCRRTRCEGITLPTPGGMTRLDPVR